MPRSACSGLAIIANRLSPADCPLRGQNRGVAAALQGPFQDKQLANQFCQISCQISKKIETTFETGHPGFEGLGLGIYVPTADPPGGGRRRAYCARPRFRLLARLERARVCEDPAGGV